ncbi:MAG: SgcJ/EcaC family oxidoreductase [Pseudomonadota bacterium]
MQIFRLFALLTILLTGALPALAQDNPIVARMEAFRSAFNAGDAETVAGFYAQDGALLPPRAKEVFGREAIARHYANAFRGGVKNLKIKVREIRQTGPASAVEIGETRVSLKGQTILGRYLHVWISQNGTWLISRDIYHVLGVQK